MPMDHVTLLANQFRQLTPGEQLQLFQQLQQIIPHTDENHAHSLLELKGLGAEVWEGVDAQEYERKERTEWNG